MKVLFAVSNEEISELIVKRYQKEYKEIISYKNVYYFNAILKELQKDKSYDRIVISEELEAFTHTQYDQIDKFIFDKLDGISDEASNLKGENIPIILICSDRREKSDPMLVKLFGIGVYDALLGNDRSVENVCNLLNKPRVKKEAKIYYKIDSDDVNYQAENENDVSEVEIQNIISHYKRLGKDEKKYVESFNNIAAQYNDVQLRIISKFLPLNVKAVLEEKSPKYQQIMSFNSKVSDNLRAQTKQPDAEKTGTSGKLLSNPDKEKILTRPVIIPSAVNMSGGKKLSKTKPQAEVEEEINEVKNNIETDTDEDILKQIINEPKEEQEIIPETPKRGRGRPRKNSIPEENVEEKPKRGRGRPRKNLIQEEQENLILPGFEEDDDSILPGITENNNIENILPGLNENDEEETILPGFNDENNNNEETVLPGFEEYDEKETTLPGFEEYDENETTLPEFEENDEEETVLPGFEKNNQPNIMPAYEENSEKQNNNMYQYEDVDISNLLTPDKKVACFVGTSKNGTSFIVNNLAEMAAQMGIDTAILDTTQNRNSYYIYTKNDEELRNIAMNSINNLLQGMAEGIKTNKNLTVYTSLPDETEGIENAGKILQTLLRKHSLVLIDCDFETPIGYFEKAQEIYMVQSFDILTIQPLTAFLRELKSKNILQENKLRAILNKAIKIRGINDKTILGGMANYNDPAMSFMTELFNKSMIKYITIPFDQDVYTKYLEGIINCEVSLKGYSKNIIQIFKELINMVYTIKGGKTSYTPPKVEKSRFSPSMNSTLEQMKKKY